MTSAMHGKNPLPYERTCQRCEATEAHDPDDYAQIIPAAGWYAEFRDDENDGVFIDPLVAWALTHIGNVVGLVAGGSMVADCTDAANFLRYVHELDLDLDRGRGDEDSPSAGLSET